MGFMDTLKKWFGGAKESAGGMAEKAKDVAGDVVEKAGDVAEGAWEKAKDMAEDVKDKFDGDDDEGGEESGG
jgi:vacuolar-type H+-ATPase subunit H